MKSRIKLAAHDLFWLNPNAPDDQCAHGTIEFTVNGIEFVTCKSGELTVTGAALFLLRTLTCDHTRAHPVAPYNTLFPHCGYAAWPYEGEFEVLLMGCDLGVEVWVSHEVAGIRLVSSAGSELVTEEEWRVAVLGLAEQVSAYYRQCSPKAEIKDDYERQGWAAFWLEWDKLLPKAC